MSLILDALRKMELERKARKQASTGMRQEVLNYRGSVRKAEKSLLIPVVAAILLTVATIGIYLYRAGDNGAPPPPAVAPPAGLPAQPVPQPVSLPAPAAPPLLPPVQQKTAGENQPQKLRTKPVPLKQLSEPVQSIGDGSLVVSGIAWQDERSLRRAVVNGQLVGEGVEIQGAKVVEIRENRVRFMRNGTVIDVSYP